MITKTMPRGIRLLYDPHLSHERLAAREHGAKSTREIDEDARIATDLLGSKLTDRLRLRGSWADGSAARDVARIMEHHGFLVDETDDAPPDQIIYENNAGLYFRGVAPSVAIGGSTVVGTGSPTIALNDATDNGGRITLTTGSGPSATGVVCTITFANPQPNGDYGCPVWAADTDANGRPAFSDFAARTTTQFTVAVTTILAATTSYHWEWQIFGRESL